MYLRLYHIFHPTYPQSGPLAEEQMYGVAFAVEEVALLLKREEFCARGGEEVGEEQEQKGEQKQDGQEQEGQKREQRQDQGGKVAIPLLTCEDLDIWLSVRLGSITGQVMSSCKVSRWFRMQFSLQMHSASFFFAK
jgi:hypothetical protein